MASTSFHVAIVGGGIVGLCLAQGRFLSRFGRA
jgi:2-polyprenyl-6-methoxyphenol hydroxylase-like FAD-dependent oxidoreductase